MPEQPTNTQRQQREDAERAKIAKGGFFHQAAVWLLSRFPFTKHRYQNWTYGRRVLVGWLLWLVCLPIIPAVAIAVWYFNDPEGFKNSPWAKGLIGLFVLWLGAFGFIATNQAQPDTGGRYSPTQQRPASEAQRQAETEKKQATKPTGSDKDQSHTSTKQSTKTKADGETKVVNDDPAAVPSDEAKRKVKDQAKSKPTNGRSFANCTEAFEAGVFNIQKGDSSYQSKLDRDGDGIACEK